MKIDDHILLWNRTSIKVLDIRHITMEYGEELRSYRLPASAFLYATRGNAKVSIDNIIKMTERFYVFHGAKGMYLDIMEVDSFECYLILYKLITPLNFRKENISQIPYLIYPNNPIFLFDKVSLMNQKWNSGNSLEKLHVKALLYEFVYEILHQISNKKANKTKLDLVEQTTQYICERYNEQITLESMAKELNYNHKYLSRKFKSQTGKSPITLLTDVRIEKAQEIMRSTNATIEEVAKYVGYSDKFYFTRIFKKHTGITPGKFKEYTINQKKVSNSTNDKLISSIVNKNIRCYNKIENENLDQYDGKDDLLMYKRLIKSMVLTLSLCFTLLLSACSGTTNNTSINENIQPKGKMVMYEAENGEIEIPENPQRVLTVSDSYVGYLLALGIKPVGMSDYALGHPFFEGKVDGIESYGDNQSVEKILELKPDLIFTFDNMEALDKMEKIAPTVAIKYGEKDFREQLREFGKILGKEKEAGEWITNWDKKVLEYKPTIQEIMKDKTVTILVGSSKGIYAYGENFGRGGEILYGEFQLKASKIIQEATMDKKEGYALLSLEKLPEYAGDYIFVAENLEEEIRENDLWKSLPAVKNNRVFTIDDDIWYFNDPVSLDKQLELIVKNLTGKSKYIIII
ncbi:AraC family transcriptional regulator [Gottschalkia acidurici]|uniref:AraC family transcriptional regulator n=1 Tax=Clostridium acidurici TaxID=1556 RepID=UPI000687D89C|nr:AraC family transcriptional regulator [Gottschalkia acidurici]